MDGCDSFIVQFVWLRVSSISSLMEFGFTKWFFNILIQLGYLTIGRKKFCPTPSCKI